jgi:DNA-binding CsgD family transcriptional regulator
MFAAAYLRCQKVEALHFLGELDAAYRIALEASSLHVDAMIVRTYCASSGLLLLADMDRFGAIPGLEDTELLDAAFATGEDNRFATLAAAHVNAATVRGNADSVASLIERALSQTKTLAYTGWAVMTLARFGTVSDADRAAELCGDEPRSGAPLLNSRTIRAIAAVRSGDRTEGHRRARAAMDLAERQRAPLHIAFLHELLGNRAAALDVYRSIGALGHVRRLSGKTPRLTRREREIADLVAAGNSNRAIAERLSLSERTVEHHAASVYSKLGFDTRAEFIATYPRIRDASLTV